MNRPRLIPVLLLKDNGLVKTVKFNKKEAKYIGDPINAVRLFNDLKVDELVFLDIQASSRQKSIDLDLVKKIGDEAYMPFSVGGGISSISQVDKILKYGAEKVIINTSVYDNLDLVKKIIDKYGSQSLVICLDVKDGIFFKNRLYKNSGGKRVKKELLQLLYELDRLSIGELIIQSINLDGTMLGYNLDLIKFVSSNISVPVIALGGCGSLDHMKEALFIGKADAVAAGSFFVFHGLRNAVLINYPDKLEVNKILKI